jgi:hypothetical protein
MSVAQGGRKWRTHNSPTFVCKLFKLDFVNGVSVEARGAWRYPTLDKQLGDTVVERVKAVGLLLLLQPIQETFEEGVLFVGGPTISAHGVAG